MQQWIDSFLETTGLSEIEPIREVLTDIDMYTIILVASLAIIIGVLQCFLGFKSFKVWCSFIGLLLGAVAGLILVVSLIPDTSEYSGVISIFFVVCLGLVGAFLAYRAYQAGVFLYAFVTLFALCYFPISAAASHNMIAVTIGLCAGVAAGVVAVIVQRICIIAATSLFGGLSVAIGLMMLFEGNGPFVAAVLPGIAALACAAGGFFVQLATTKKPVKEPQPVPVTIVPVQGMVYAPPVDGSATATATPTAAPTPAPAPAPAEATEAPPEPAAEAPPEPEAPPAQDADSQ